jgi:hypothetical protein
VGGRSGKVAQKMYTHVSKCKNDKIKKQIKVFSPFAHLLVGLFVLLVSTIASKSLGTIVTKNVKDFYSEIHKMLT